MYCSPRDGHKNEGLSGVSEAECISKCEAKGLEVCNAVSWNANEGHCSTYTNCQGTKVDVNYDTTWMCP